MSTYLFSSYRARRADCLVLQIVYLAATGLKLVGSLHESCKAPPRPCLTPPTSQASPVASVDKCFEGSW